MTKVFLKWVTKDIRNLDYWILFIFQLSTILVTDSTYTLADTVKDQLQSALETRAKAMNNYYNGVRSLGPGATQAQKDALQTSILNPAQQSWNKAFQNAITTRAQELRQAIYDEAKRHFPGEFIPKYILNPTSLLGLKSKKLSNKSFLETLTPKTPSASTDENTGPVLDGSKIPKEVTFKGRAKKGLKPSPNASPSPSPDIEVEGSNKTDVIEFMPAPKPVKK